VDIEKEKF